MGTRALSPRRPGIGLGSRVRIADTFQLLALMAPAVLFFVLFQYIPMYGVVIAFKDFSPARGILGSEWAGMKYFVQAFTTYKFGEVFTNTLLLSLFNLLFSFPVPIALALMLNHTVHDRFRKTVQTISYAPYFISQVVLIGMVSVAFLSPRTGLANHFLRFIGLDPINFLAEPSWFRPLFIGTGVWQLSGYQAIVFLAAISTVNPELYEAAIIDGASKVQRIRYIDLPSILPTVMVVLLLRIGHLLQVGWQKALLMQTPLNLSASEMLQTYVYKTGLLEARYSYAAAMGLFVVVVNLILVTLFNKISKRVSGAGLW